MGSKSKERRWFHQFYVRGTLGIWPRSTMCAKCDRKRSRREGLFWTGCHCDIVNSPEIVDRRRRVQNCLRCYGFWAHCRGGWAGGRLPILSDCKRLERRSNSREDDGDGQEDWGVYEQISLGLSAGCTQGKAYGRYVKELFRFSPHIPSILLYVPTLDILWVLYGHPLGPGLSWISPEPDTMYVGLWHDTFREWRAETSIGDGNLLAIA